MYYNDESKGIWSEVWENERQSLKQSIELVQAEIKRKESNKEVAAINAKNRAQGRKGNVVKVIATAERDALLDIKSKYDTLPNPARVLVNNMEVYDRQLLADAIRLRELAFARGRDGMRPFYRALLEAYEASIMEAFYANASSQMKYPNEDPQITAFFDKYVHDSLADFGRDATRPSDPRIIYAGGDKKLPYAKNRLNKSATDC